MSGIILILISDIDGMNLQFLNPLRWRRSFLFSVLLLLLIVWFGFFDTYSVRTRIQLSNEKKELTRETERLYEEAEAFNQEREALEKDPALLEKVAREEYGMRKPGETIYRIQEK
ncbi:septum formation initiator family protein [Balneolaceae bacterium ANBcel3]|nr:septum formation initiator family protein [Balneolaceae bacterium ANBcel3]